MTPLFRKASSRSRCSRVVKSNSVLLKVSVLGRNVISVPVACPSRPDPSGRAGAGVTYDYVLDPVEKTHRETLFRWEHNGWTEMDLSSITR